MIPDKFLVEYGSILHPEEGFSVTLQNSSLIYKDGNSTVLFHPITPTKQDWKDFCNKVEAIGLGEWNEHYDLCCFDGTQWKVQISLEGLEVESEGTNDFPDSFMEFIGELEDLMDMDLKLNFP